MASVSSLAITANTFKDKKKTVIAVVEVYLSFNLRTSNETVPSKIVIKDYFYLDKRTTNVPLMPDVAMVTVGRTVTLIGWLLALSVDSNEAYSQ